MYSYNPYNAYSSPQFPQRTDIIHINGENGARAFQMLPNSSALLLDDTAPLVWLAQTDGAGYKTVTPYKIEEYKPTTTSDLESRIRKLEEIINAKSNVEQTVTAEQRPRNAGSIKVKSTKSVHADDADDSAVPSVC